MVKGSLRFRLRHRAGDTWHPLVELPDPRTETAEPELPEGARRSRFRCNECDLDILAIGELWQEGTMDW